MLFSMKRYLVVFVALGLMAGLVGCGDGGAEAEAEAEAQKWYSEYQLETTWSDVVEALGLSAVSGYEWVDKCVVQTQTQMNFEVAAEYGPASEEELKELRKKYYRNLRDGVTIDSVSSSSESNVELDWWEETQDIRAERWKPMIWDCSKEVLSGQEFARLVDIWDPE